VHSAEDDGGECSNCLGEFLEGKRYGISRFLEKQGMDEKAVLLCLWWLVFLGQGLGSWGSEKEGMLAMNGPGG
jgi:hypothetical protein